MDVILTISTEKETGVFMRKLNFNMLDEIIIISDLVKGSRFEETKIKSAKTHITKLQKAICIPEKELIYFCVVFRLNCEYKTNTVKIACSPCNLISIAEYFGVSVFDILKDFAILQSLIEKEICARASEYNSDLFHFINGGLVIQENIFQSMLQNNRLIIEAVSESNSRNKFLNKVGELPTASFATMRDRVICLEINYKHCEFIKKCKKIHFFYYRALFYILCFHEYKARSNRHSSLLSTLKTSFTDWAEILNELSQEDNYLRREGYINVTVSEFYEDIEISLTDKALDMFFGEEAKLYKKKDRLNTLLNSNKIKEKELFYDEKTKNQVNTIENSLEEKKFMELKTRLGNEKMNTGICILFYGAPGTGKTEAVKQIARTTGRDIFNVDISEQKSCWFGESEKQIKRLFEKYKRECLCAKKIKKQPIPILLFNEADAVISKRKDVEMSNIAQTENTIQNIILEQLENFDGIMIATTNLAENFDKAFERRFLFKIKFEKPSAEIASKIWRSKLNDLSKEEASELASEYDFSGGEIDNISRKIIVDKVVTGETPTFEKIKYFCGQEKLDFDASKQIGFCV